MPDSHESPLPTDPQPAPSPIDEHNLPPELCDAQNGTLTLDPASGFGAIMLHNAVCSDAPDTPMEWARPILELFSGGAAQPATYMELHSECTVAIWAHFMFEQEWQKFEFSFAGQACAVELATAGAVPVTGRRWRDAPLTVAPFVGAIERTLQIAADLANEHRLPLNLTAISSNGYIPDAARPVTFTPWLNSPRVDVDPDAMRSYLQLYEEALESCPEGRLAAFVLPERRTFATRDPNKLVEWAFQQAKQPEVSVYLHTGLHILPEGPGEHRGSIVSARAVIGLFADIDAWAPGRKKSKETLCPTPADAMKVVEKFDELYTPIATTLLIASGNGCYPALLFKEPYLVESDEDRELLDSFNRRFRLALHLIASESGSTGAVEGCDLAKVLRLPGTLHRKDPNNPKPVLVIYRDVDRRYTLSDLDELLPPLLANQRSSSRTTKTRQQSVDGTIVLDLSAEPPAEKLNFLLQNSVKFNLSWNHRRSDFKDDDSQSVYDLSLAHWAASAEWSDQEIVNLLIANRREHGGQPKLREDYYLRTITRAREGATSPAGEANAEEDDHGIDDARIGSKAQREPTSTDIGNGRPDPSDSAGKTNTSNGGREDGKAQSNKNDANGIGTAPEAAPDKKVLLQLLSESLGVPIERVVKYVGEPASYRIDTKKGTVKLPVIDNLVGQSKLRLAIAEVTGLWFKPFTRATWHLIVRTLLQACELVDLGEDATRRGQMIQWLTGYLREKSIQPTLEAADEGKEPFHVEDRVCIFLSGLKEWLKVRHGEKPTDLAAQLKDFGAEHMPSIDVIIRDKKTTRGAWKIPSGSWIP